MNDKSNYLVLVALHLTAAIVRLYQQHCTQLHFTFSFLIQIAALHIAALLYDKFVLSSFQHFSMELTLFFFLEQKIRFSCLALF